MGSHGIHVMLLMLLENKKVHSYRRDYIIFNVGFIRKEVSEQSDPYERGCSRKMSIG